MESYFGRRRERLRRVFGDRHEKPNVLRWQAVTGRRKLTAHTVGTPGDAATFESQRDESRARKMNESTFKLAQGFVSKAYVEQAQFARHTRERLIETLLSQRRSPDRGWDDVSLELFMSELAAMDSNNFIGTPSMKKNRVSRLRSIGRREG